MAVGDASHNIGAYDDKGITLTQVSGRGALLLVSQAAEYKP